MLIDGTRDEQHRAMAIVYKTSLFTDNELSTVLTSGGHNAASSRSRAMWAHVQVRDADIR